MGRSTRIALGVVGLLVLVTATAVAIGDPTLERTTVIWVAEKTTSAPGGMPAQLRSRLSELVEDGPADLVAYAVGERAVPASPGPVGLLVTREGGEPEHDRALREAGLDRQVATVTDAVASVDVGRSGFSLYAALRAVDAELDRTKGRVEVWLSTTVLAGSVDPLAVPAMMAGEPGQVLDELRPTSVESVDLDGVTVHPILLTPIGAGQEPMNPATDAWRSAFVADLVSRFAGVSHPVRHDQSTNPPWSHASETPPVPVIVERTPTVPPPPGVFLIDTMAFQPNSDLLVDVAATATRLNDIVTAYQPGHLVEVVGYCAAFGPPDSARELSKRRAGVIAEMLEKKGIPRSVITADGRGFDERPVPDEPPRSAAQRVVAVTVRPAG